MAPETNGKLLLVEDDIELRETLEEIFLLHNLPFDVAKNVPEAKELVKGTINPYSLVLSDYLMPGESGLDFYEFLKRQNGYESIPFYILSARTEDEVKNKCMDAGVSGFVKKPFEIRQLVEIVKREMDI